MPRPRDSNLSKSEQAFCEALGKRMAKRRKQLGLTQAEVASALDIAQQTYGHYEVGRFRIAVTSLPALASILMIDTDTLLGITGTPSKRGPASRSGTRSKR